jgi:cytochrome c biogenesis protein CcmG/thiol:disulfide interchange protein DsbE
MKKTLLPLILFLGMAALFYFVLGKMNKGEYNPRDIPTEFIGRTAPEFALPELFDISVTVRPSDMKGKVWLLNVWGTWCPECWREHDYLLKLKRDGVPIIGLNWRDGMQEAKNFLNKKGNPFLKVAFDPKSVAVIEYGVYGAPETFLIDADGVIREKHAGAMTPAVWNEKFEPWFTDDGSTVK